MLEIQYIRNNKEEVIERLSIKNFNTTSIIDEAITADEKRRSAQKEMDDLLAESKTLAKEIGILYKQGKGKEAEELKIRTGAIKNLTKDLGNAMEAATITLQECLQQIPNLPHESVPPGKSAEDNEIIHSEGILPDLSGESLPHWELASLFDIINFELGSKVTGAGFPFYKGAGAKLQRALINFFLEEAIQAGYTEFQPPLLVNEDSAFATGNLPDKDGQMYKSDLDNLYLIPTAEVPVTNIFRDMILSENDLPIKSTAYSSCFRREAGSYGKDVRGLNRLHQFDKVEIVQITHPEKSYDALEEMKEHVAGLLRKLEMWRRHELYFCPNL